MRFFCSLVAVLVIAPLLDAAELDPDAVAVTVGEQAISVRVMERELRKVTPQLPEEAAALERLRTAVCETMVKRALVQQALAAQKQGASEADAAQAVKKLQQDVADRGLTWEAHLKAMGLSEAEFKTELRWQLSWESHLNEQLTDAQLQRYFEQHARDFDGTQLRVAHILFKASDRETAAKVREEIASGKLTFAAAAEKHSQSPSGKMGGDIGLIERNKPMPEAFSAAAFALKPGEVSRPVETSFGVHLITLVEVTPGERAFAEAREEVRVAATRHLFDWLAERQRKTTKIVYTKSYPHLSP
jgi:parvulin-like peptidyl-prolyl isomerase